MSSSEIKMKKHGLCPPRALGLVESITCPKANLTQYHNCFGGVYVRGGLGGEERVPTSAWRAQGQPQRGGSVRAENRKKHLAFLGTKSGQSVHVNICGDVERRNARGTGKRHVWLLHSTSRGHGQIRLQSLERACHGGPCMSYQGADILCMLQDDGKLSRNWRWRSSMMGPGGWGTCHEEDSLGRVLNGTIRTHSQCFQRGLLEANPGQRSGE